MNAYSDNGQDEFCILPISDYEIAKATTPCCNDDDSQSQLPQMATRGEVQDSAIGNLCEVVMAEVPPDEVELQSGNKPKPKSNKRKARTAIATRPKDNGRITRSKKIAVDATPPQTRKRSIPKRKSAIKARINLKSGCDYLDEDSNETEIEAEVTSKVIESRDTKTVRKVPGEENAYRKLKYPCDQCERSFAMEYQLKNHKKYHATNRPFKCQNCDACFKKKTILRCHEKIHTGIRPYKCQDCESAFPTRTALKFHRMRHTGEKPHQCPYCDYRCSRKATLLIHLRIHTNDRPFACDECDLKFRLRHHLRQHKLIHSGEKPYLCSVCGMKSRQLAQHLTHMNIHKASDNFKCDKCGLTFKLHRQLKNHQLTIHDCNKSVLKCDECQLNFNTRATYNRHCASHGNTKPYQCNICGLKCRVKAQLKQHNRTHTGEKPFKCRFCDYACSLKTSLIHHERIHTNERPFQCDTCGVTFKLKSHLKQHVLIHIDARPFKCQHCDKTFRQMAALQLHRQTHTDQKPFSCDECDATFRLKKELSKHKILHVTDNPFKCDFCHSIFRLKEHLKQHLKSHMVLQKSFKCDICGSSFRQKTHLTQHQKSHSTVKPYQCQICPSAFRVKSNLRRHELGHVKKKGIVVKNDSVDNVKPNVSEINLNVRPNPNNYDATSERDTKDFSIPVSATISSNFMENFKNFVMEYENCGGNMNATHLPSQLSSSQIRDSPRDMKDIRVSQTREWVRDSNSPLSTRVVVDNYDVVTSGQGSTSSSGLDLTEKNLKLISTKDTGNKMGQQLQMNPGGDSQVVQQLPNNSSQNMLENQTNYHMYRPPVQHFPF